MKRLDDRTRRQRGSLKGITMRPGQRLGRSLRWSLLLVLSLWLWVTMVTLLHASEGQSPTAQAQVQAPGTALSAEARANYAAGNYSLAADGFEQAAAATGDSFQKAALLANASLAHQQAGNWQSAEMTIQQARNLVLPLGTETAEGLAIAAQIQDVEARLLLSRGQPEAAALSWEAAATAYERSGQRAKAQQAQLNQAQALQSAGFYRRSVDLLTTLAATLESQPPSALASKTARSLGDARRLTGDWAAAETQYQKSLQIAQELGMADESSLSLRKLGDLNRTRGQADRALEFYAQAVAIADSPLLKFQGELAKLYVWVEAADWSLAYEQGQTLWAMQADLPIDRPSLYSRIELLRSLQRVRQAIANTLADDDPVPTTDWYIFVQSVFETDLNQLRRNTTSRFSRTAGENPLWYVIDKHFPPLAEVAAQLQTLRQTALELGDVQAEATVLGTLGALYEQVEDWTTAEQLTREGLLLAQTNGLGQVAYELQAQLGRIELATGDHQAAIESYRASVQTLQALREDVVAVSSEAQYSFQQSIEPIYRELATLLLTEDADEANPDDLKQAREVIELLQLAELDNFFREACLSSDTVDIDQIDNRAAVLYPILLPDRLDIVVSLPDRTFKNFAVPVTPDVIAQTVSSLQAGLTSPRSDATTRGGGLVPELIAEGALEFESADQIQVLPLAATLYDWLIRPAEAVLAQADVQTLVFVLDGSLRSVPMSVLYDGEQYLIEKYAIALTPGLRLVNPEPLPDSELSIILAGLSEQGRSPKANEFSPLPFVENEVDTIEQLFPSTVILNENFSVENFRAQVGTLPAPVVHLATHGKFGATLDETFILTWDEALDADRFSDILLTSELSRETPIELLVLSACETAVGDNLSVLGLAGISIRSGARSTLASLWQVDDLATSQLMGEFYQRLGKAEISKAEAIRQAQLSMLQQSDYQHPYFWSAFVLLGNWL